MPETLPSKSEQEWPKKTEVYPRDTMLNIISPINGCGDNGEEEIVGYVILGFSLESLFEKLKGLNPIIIIT